MSSIRGGGGFPSRQGLNPRNYAQSDQAQVIMEIGQYDVDTEIEGLRTSVGRLKEMSKAIGEEAQLQKNITEQLAELLDQAQGKLKKSMKRLNRVYRESRSNQWIYLTLFVVAIVVFVVIYRKLVSWVRFFMG
eukprot:jgi/Botrbrau1/12811/Bobra.20_1s0002.1